MATAPAPRRVRSGCIVGTSGCIIGAYGVYDTSGLWHVVIAVGVMCASYAHRVNGTSGTSSSPTAVYSRVVRISLVVMDVVWFCTARVYIVVDMFRC